MNDADQPRGIAQRPDPVLKELPLATSPGPDPQFQPSLAWAAVGILLVLSFFSFLDRQLIALLVDPIKRDLALSDTQLGLLQGLAFALLYSVAGLPIGWATDRKPRKLIVLSGMALWSLSAAACGLTRNFWQMFACRTGVGVGEASLSPVAVSLIGDLFPRDRVAAPMGVYSGGYYIGGGAALAFGGWLVSLFGKARVISIPVIGPIAPWQATFLAAGLAGLIVAPLALALHDPRPARRLRASRSTAGPDGLRTHMQGRWRPASVGLVAFGLASLVNYAIAAWTPAYMMRVLGWSPAAVGSTFGLVVALSGGIGALVGGHLLDRLFRAGRYDAYFLVAGTASIIALPLVVSAYLVHAPTLTLALLCGGLTMLGAVAACSFSTWQIVAPPAARGQMTALFVLVSALFGTGLGPVFVGAITDFVMKDPKMVGYSIALVAAVVLPTMAALLLSARGPLRLLVEADNMGDLSMAR